MRFGIFHELAQLNNLGSQRIAQQFRRFKIDLWNDLFLPSGFCAVESGLCDWQLRFDGR